MGAQVERDTETLFDEERIFSELCKPLNGTDSRRRLEDKLEEARLRRELKEFDFEY